MKYIKTYEILEDGIETENKFYWSLPKDEYYFFAGLKKIGCPEKRIKEMWENIITDVRKPTATRLFVGFNKNIKAINRRWNYEFYTTPIENFHNFFYRYKYEYQGPIKLTREELEQIQLQKNVEKYNL